MSRLATLCPRLSEGASKASSVASPKPQSGKELKAHELLSKFNEPDRADVLHLAMAHAVSYNLPSMLRSLLASGARPNRPSLDDDMLLLEKAERRNLKEITDILKEAGATMEKEY